MRRRQLTGFFRHLRGGALRTGFIPETRLCIRLTCSILRSFKCYGVWHGKEWSLYTVLTRPCAICWIFALLGILISCSSPGFGNCVTIFLPMMLPTLCWPKIWELRWLRGTVDWLLPRAMPHPSSCINSTYRFAHFYMAHRSFRRDAASDQIYALEVKWPSEAALSSDWQCASDRWPTDRRRVERPPFRSTLSDRN